MTLFSDIQMELVDGKSPIGPILMKLRLLAARLGSSELEEWVKYEAEGYPQDAELPTYRVLGMSMSGHFDYGFGKRIENAPIPPAVVEQVAGEGWSNVKLRESAAAVDAILEAEDGLHLDLSNLMLLLQGKVYEGSACQQIRGFVSHSAIVEASNAVRNRILELTIELAKKIPDLDTIELGQIPKVPEIATRVYHQTVHGDMTYINSSGDNATIQTIVATGSESDLLKVLLSSGLSDADSKELADLISSQKGDESDSGLGERARKWLAARVTGGVDATVKGGVSALMKIAEEAAMQYWGLK